MKIQRDDFSCGVNALINALGAMGKHISESEARKNSGTTSRDGVTQFGILQVIDRIGFNHKIIEAPFKEAHKYLIEHLETGNSAVILTENSNHWEAAIGVLGKRIIVFDGQKSANTKKEAGVFVLSVRQLQFYWKSENNLRYAILIKP